MLKRTGKLSKLLNSRLESLSLLERLAIINALCGDSLRYFLLSHECAQGRMEVPVLNKEELIYGQLRDKKTIIWCNEGHFLSVTNVKFTKQAWLN